MDQVLFVTTVYFAKGIFFLALIHAIEACDIWHINNRPCCGLQVSDQAVCVVCLQYVQP